MFKCMVSIGYILALLYAQPCYGSSNSVPSYGLCDVGDVITDFNGLITGSYGVDCTRVLLAPKGYRIEITFHKNSRTGTHLYFYDGGTSYKNRAFSKFPRFHVYGDDQTVTSTSNAILIHMDKLSSPAILNMSFVMFRQAPERCECLSVTEGRSVCTLSTGIYRGDSLQRDCTVHCKNGYFIPVQNFLAGTLPYSLKCYLDHNKNEDSWTNIYHAQTLQDPNLVTCSKFNPATATISGFTFNYDNVSCQDINMTFIEDKVREHIMSNSSVPSVGECFKVEKNRNCTVERLNVTCSNLNNGTTSQIKLLIRDNIPRSDNVNITRNRYKDLLQLFKVDLPQSLVQFISQNLAVANANANKVTRLLATYLAVSCPRNEISPHFEHNALKGCVACPKYFHKVSHLGVYERCQNCSKGTQGESSQDTCVPGLRNYSKPSFDYCNHTCAIGKYYNFNSSLCEWCPYGFYQNSSGTVNPVCLSCPNGTTTGFVGAKNISYCIHLCPVGHYLHSLTCERCSVGYFMPNGSNRYHKCHQCPLQSTTLDSGSSGCVEKCLLGQYFNISQGVCVLCPNNTYQDEAKDNNTRSCKNCPLKTITANVGSKTLLECLGPCRAGQFVDVQIRNCTPCPQDTYHDIAEHVSFTCTPCGEYKITQSTGSVNISECIYTCSQGEFFNKTINQCTKCPIDTYQDQVGKDMCMPCLGKQFTLKNGSKECIKPCPYGQLLNKSAEKCQDCPKGYYQHISDHKLESCVPCLLDFYSNKLGRRNCTACAGQTITLTTAASLLSDCINPCKPGTFLNKTSQSCQECTKGFYQDQQQYRLHDCVECPSVNLTTIGSGASSVTQCVGYCASYPCLNGGECIDIDNGFNCTCAQHLSGKTCEVIIDEKDTDSMEVSVRFPDLIWNQSLSNPNSQEFIELARNVEDNVRQEFKNDANFRTVKVKEFRQGSVISDLEFNSVYGRNFTAPVDTLSSIIADGNLGNLKVDGSSLKVVNLTCRQPLGMEDGRIPDNAITSLGTLFYLFPKNARLNFPGPGWAPRTLSNDVILQVDFLEEVMLTGVATQGSSFHGGSWLKSYYLQHSLDGNNWSYYQRDSIKYDIDIHVLYGNTDVNTTVRNELKYHIRTRYIRIFQHYFNQWNSYRIEFYGCPIPKTVPLPTQPPPPTPTGLQNSTTVVAGVDDEDGADVGLIVGLVLAGLLLVLIIFLVGVYWCRVRKNNYSQICLEHGSTVDVVEMKNASSL